MGAAKQGNFVPYGEPVEALTDAFSRILGIKKGRDLADDYDVYSGFVSDGKRFVRDVLVPEMERQGYTVIRADELEALRTVQQLANALHAERGRNHV